MAVTVAGLFARAWRREQFGLTQRVPRGALWFALYLTMIVCRERITFGHHHSSGMRVLMFALAQGPVWLFWSLTPALLVRNGGRSLIHLALAGLAGVVIDGVIIPLSSRAFFPLVLDGWVDLGPIGIAMALFTWVRGDRHRLGHHGVRRRRAVGAQRPVRHRGRGPDRTAGRLVREVLLVEVAVGLDRVQVAQHGVEVLPQRAGQVRGEPFAHHHPQH